MKIERQLKMFVFGVLLVLLSSIVSAQSFVVPTTWTYYEMNGAFSISVPPTMEMRHDYDTYTKQIAPMKKYLATDAVVFQQKGLSAGGNNDHYARIIIQYTNGEKGDFPKSSKTAPLENEILQEFKNLPDGKIGLHKLLSEPTCRWITINNLTKALVVEYRRTAGGNYTTHCSLYYLYNDSELAEITVSYREQEKQLWVPDLDNVIKTFNWKKIK